MPSDNYFLLLVVTMAIIFSLSPINRAIERHRLREVTRRRAVTSADDSTRMQMIDATAVR